MIEEEILQCERSAYGGPSGEVNTYYEHLKRNYPAKKWYRGEKTIFTRQVGFIFRVWRESRMLQYFRLFMSSGIYNHVSNQVSLNDTVLRERELKSGENWKLRYETSSFQVVKLGGSIQTVFILLVTCLAACFSFLVFEYVKYKWANIVKRGTLIWVRFTKIQFWCDKKIQSRIYVRRNK